MQVGIYNVKQLKELCLKKIKIIIKIKKISYMWVTL